MSNQTPPDSLRLRLVCCEVFNREITSAVSGSRHQIDLTFLSKDLHQLETRLMRSELQQIINETKQDLFDALILGYGLCGRGTVGLQSNTLPIILPRAHDCMTLFFGGRIHVELCNTTN